MIILSRLRAMVAEETTVSSSFASLSYVNAYLFVRKLHIYFLKTAPEPVRHFTVRRGHIIAV